MTHIIVQLSTTLPLFSFQNGQTENLEANPEKVAANRKRPQTTTKEILHRFKEKLIYYYLLGLD